MKWLSDNNLAQLSGLVNSKSDANAFAEQTLNTFEEVYENLEAIDQKIGSFVGMLVSVDGETLIMEEPDTGTEAG